MFKTKEETKTFLSRRPYFTCLPNPFHFIMSWSLKLPGLTQSLWGCLAVQTGPRSVSRSLQTSSVGRSQENDDGIQEQEKRTGPGEKFLNQVTLLGRVGITPQSRGSSSNPVVSFSLATNYRYKPQNSDDWVTKTDWHNVICFKRGLKESIEQNVSKGSRVYVSGRIMYGSIEDNAGNVRHTSTIVAEDLIRLSSGRDKAEE